MNRIPLAVLEAVCFPLPLAFFLYRGWIDVVPALHIILGGSLLFYLQLSETVYNARLNYHTAGYGYALCTIPLLYTAAPSVTSGILLSLPFALLAVLFLAFTETHVLSPLNGIAGLLLLLVIMIISAKLPTAGASNLTLPLRGLLHHNLFLLTIPFAAVVILFLSVRIFRNARHAARYIVSAASVLYVIVSSGLLLPVFPIRRIHNMYTRLFFCRLMIYIPLYAIVLLRFLPQAAFAGTLASIGYAGIMLYNRRSMYSESRIGIISPKR